MQTLPRPIRRNSDGVALLIIMIFLGVCLLVFSTTMYWISSNSSITARNNQYNLSQAAAEAATEKVLSQMNYDYVAQSLSNSATYYGSMIPTTSTNQQANWPINDQSSWPIKYTYSDTNGVTGQISVNMGAWTTNTVPLTSEYTNLYGLVQPVTITATATPIGQKFSVPATVTESIQFASIPLFQFAVFYNMNLEIDPGEAMTITGPVWSNAGIWTGSTVLTLQNTVSAVQLATNCTPDPFCFDLPTYYDGSGPSTYSKAGQPTSGNDRITMPIDTNNNPSTVEGLINLPPATYSMGTAAAYSTNGQAYFANGADLFLTNFINGTNWGTLTPSGTNMIMYYDDGANGPSSYLTQIPYDFYIMTNHHSGGIFFTNWVATNSIQSTNYNYYTNIIYAGYSFVTNDIFYDWREGWNGGSGVNSGKGKAVQAVQIDLQYFNAWLAGSNYNGSTGAYVSTNVNGGQSFNQQCQLSSHKSHPIDSIYIWNDVPLTGTTLPAVRVVNGGMLPPNTLGRGFTVATAMPLYVWGNYNASNTAGSSLGQTSDTYTWPAAFMADAITILSTNWNDATTSKNPTPGATTVNAAMLEGIVQSTTNSGVYSGGLENFLRLLESWSSSIPLTYNGSIVVMFPSQYATNSWLATGNYYNAPKRNWAFNTNFVQQAGLPPLTPQAKGVIRASWFAY